MNMDMKEAHWQVGFRNREQRRKLERNSTTGGGSHGEAILQAMW